MSFVDASRSRLLHPHTGSMEDMDLPNPRSLSQPKHGMKGSNLSQEYATIIPNQFIQDYNLLSRSILV